MIKIDVFTSLYIDPAFSNKQGTDKTAITVVGTTPMDVWYVIAAVTTKNNNPTTVAETVMSVAGRYRPQASGLEIVGGQVLYMTILKPVFEHLNLPPLRGYNVTSRQDKHMRIRRVLEPRHRDGRLIFSRDLSELIGQVRSFPQLEHDDLIDSLAGHEHVSKIPRMRITADEIDDSEEYFDEDTLASMSNGSWIGRRNPRRTAA